MQLLNSIIWTVLRKEFIEEYNHLLLAEQYQENYSLINE